MFTFQPRGWRVRLLFQLLSFIALAPAARLAAQQLMTVTIAGVAGSRGTVDGPALNARFEFPVGVAVDSTGNIYVVDQNHSVIRKISAAGVVTTLAGTPGLTGSINGVGPAALFAFPEALTVDPQGNVFVCESSSATIRKITPAGVVSTFAGTAQQNGSGSSTLDGIGPAARFGYPYGITIDSAGNLYVTDRGWRTIRKITPAAVVTTFAGSIATGGGIRNGTGASAGFNDPGGISIDAEGNLFVLETSMHVIRRITPTAVVTSQLGEFLISGSADGPDHVARFNLPTGITRDAAGNLYIADSANFTIRKRMAVSSPVFTAQPQSVTVNSGQTATFSAQANATPAATFQWRKNGVNIPGATSSTLTIANVRTEDAGNYSVVATNLGGVTASATAALILNSAPAITAHPASQSVNDGQPLVLRAEVSNPSGATFRWLKNGLEIPGASESTLTLRNVTPADAGNYSAVITNSAGSVTTSVALVTVLSSRFVNLSVRTRAGNASAALIVGFVVAGDGKPLLIRGDGAVLAQYGVAGPLADPVLTVYNGSSVVASNDDWSASADAASIADTAAKVGAFALPNPSRDAALLRSLAAGTYTAHVFAGDNVPGIALTELYDANALGAGRLVNLSARARVEGGDATLIAGFVLAGNTRKRVLIRGAGPALAALGVPGALANPRLSVFQNSIVPIATNDDWSADVAASTAAVGAFPFAPGSPDAALVLSLDPGAYTAQVAGSGDTTGNALVEIYELP